MRGVILYSDEFRFQTDFNLSNDRVSSKLRVTEKLCLIDLSHLQFIYIYRYLYIYLSIYLSIYLYIYIYIYCAFEQFLPDENSYINDIMLGVGTEATYSMNNLYIPQRYIFRPG